MDRLNLALDTARRALSTLEELAGGGSPTLIERDAAIQRNWRQGFTPACPLTPRFFAA
jgi:hypothetical protein